jgi:RpiB/LacA/LacB family sugar-phosphate isomerase
VVLNTIVEEWGEATATGGPEVGRLGYPEHMRIAIAGDHAGFEMKQDLAEHIRGLGHEVIDLGACNTEPSDYPDFADAVTAAVISGKAERGVLVCGSGVGASIAANKVAGIRAGLCHDHYSAHQGVEHDAMNILVLGGRVIGIAPAKEIVAAFLGAAFSGEARHQRRLDKVMAMEARYNKAASR